MAGRDVLRAAPVRAAGRVAPGLHRERVVARGDAHVLDERILRALHVHAVRVVAHPVRVLNRHLETQRGMEGDTG